MNFVIGDVHGEVSKLKSLIQNILHVDKKPKLTFLGDYLDKGENPFQTLSLLEKIKKDFECTFLIGNHEYYWLKLNNNVPKIYNYLWKYGALSTMKSFCLKSNDLFILKKKMLDKFKTFFNCLEPYQIIDNFIIVHSGIHPNDFNKEIERIKIERLLFNRYGFLLKKSKYLERFIIFGHTGFYFPFYDSYKIGIDTAACYINTQPLTAFCIETRQFIDSNNTILELAAVDINFCPIIPRMLL